MQPPLLLIGSYEWALTCLPEHVVKEGVDVLHVRGDRMKIDDVRSIIENAYLTPLVGEERSFVIAFPEFTHEAQNALLKIIEEPPTTSRFYIVTHRPGELLPTLRSRLVVVDVESRDGADAFDTFFLLPYAERLSLIGSKMAKKDDAWAHALMNAYEKRAHGRDARIITSVLTFRSHFNAPGASKKMILEHLALVF